jgi:tetratricopeptide (TPR) repeat protein
LTKSSALLLVPALVVGFVWKAAHSSQSSLSAVALAKAEVQNPESMVISSRKLIHVAGQLGFVLAVSLLVCGWHYFRVWRHFGTPLVNSWEARAGLHWWQEDGYRTSSFFLRFGHVLRDPWQASFTSFADGFYSTLWGDGNYGFERLAERAPWNYDQMALGYWLAVPLSFALLAGTVLAVAGFVRNPRPEWAMLLCLGFLSMFALVFYSLNAPFQCMVKAFHVMGALVPFCAFGALGLEAFSRKRAGRAACCLWFGIWAINTYVSFWILPNSTAVTLIRAGLITQEKPATAMQELEALLQREPGNVEARAMLLPRLIANGNNQEATNQMDILARENPNDAEAQLNLAWAYAHQNQTVQAIEHARNALAIAPGYSPAYKHLAWFLLQSDRYGEAAEVAHPVEPGTAFRTRNRTPGKWRYHQRRHSTWSGVPHQSELAGSSKVTRHHLDAPWMAPRSRESVPGGFAFEYQ